MFNQQTWLAPGCTLLVMLRQRWITPSPSVCLSLAWSCLPTLKANICSFITFPLLLSSPVDALLTPSGPNMKSGLSLAAAALVAVLLSSVDAQGRKTAVHSQSYLHSLSPPTPVFPRLPLPPPLVFTLRWFFITEIWCFIVHLNASHHLHSELDVLIKRNKVLDSRVCYVMNAVNRCEWFSLQTVTLKLYLSRGLAGSEAKSRSGCHLTCI